MKKALVSLLLLSALLLNCLAFVGCDKLPGANGPTITDVPDDLNYDGSAVEITFYHTMGTNLKTVLDKYVAKFNEKYPNIKVTHSQEGGYDDVREKISTELTAGDHPNIAYCYPDHVALYNLAGAVLTLDALINNTQVVPGTNEVFGLTAEQKADFISAYYSEGAQFGDGKMYTMPLSKSTEVLYYNKTFFEANNLKVPTTWDELEAVARQIKALDPTCIPLGYDSEANWFITMCEQLNTPYTAVGADGEGQFLFNDPKNHEFVSKFGQWYTDGLLTTQELYGAYTSGLFVAQEGIKSYMSIGSSAGATHQRPKATDSGEYPFEVGITTIPQADPNNKKVISQGPSLCIFNGTEQEVAASWLFVKFLTTNVEFQAEFSMVSGYVPVIQSVTNEALAVYEEKTDANGNTVKIPKNAVATYIDFLKAADGGANIAALSVKVCLEQKDAYYVSPAFNGSSVARDQVGALLQSCLVKYKDAPDKAAMIKKEFENAVAQCEYLS